MATAELDVAPLREWCERAIKRHGDAKAFAAACDVHDRQVHRILNESETVTLAVADSMLTAEGSTRLDDLYPMQGGGDRVTDRPASKAFPYDFEILDVDRLFVDHSYQRPLTSFARRIEQNFDPALVGTLVVSERAEGDEQVGFYAIVDGQTRANAIAALASRDEARCTVPCLVYHGMTVADEARMFAKLQKERRGVSSFHRFRADLVAGEPEATAIAAIVGGAGYELGEGSPEKVSAVAALERVHRWGPDLLARVMSTLFTAWGGSVVPKGDVIKGLGYLLKNEEIDDARMADRLAGVTTADLLRRAIALREGRGGGSNAYSYMAEVMRGVYRSRAAA